MKPYLLTGLCLLFAVSGAGGLQVSAQASAPVSVAAPSEPADELEQLVAPIALYADVLVALILPSAVESADVVLAARFLANGGKEIDAQPWDENVKGLARYPEIVKWMDENLEWTRQIGAAYAENPEAVMTAIQRARARAMAKGLLTSTPEQNVVVENGAILIVPAQPAVVYVPRYDPKIIYVERRVFYHWPDPWLTFGVAYGVGWWLRNDCDWGRHVIVIDRRPRDHWRHHWHHRYATPGHGPRFDGHHWKPWTPHPRQLHRLQAHRHIDQRGYQTKPSTVTGASHVERHERHRWERDHRREFAQPAPAAPKPNPAFGVPRGTYRPPTAVSTDRRVERSEWRQSSEQRGERDERRQLPRAPAPVATKAAQPAPAPAPRFNRAYSSATVEAARRAAATPQTNAVPARPPQVAVSRHRSEPAPTERPAGFGHGRGSPSHSSGSARAERTQRTESSDSGTPSSRGGQFRGRGDGR